MREPALLRLTATLHEARKAAGMPVAHHPPRALSKTAHHGLLLRLVELEAQGEPDPVGLLEAVLRAKVHEHATRKGERSEAYRRGQYANGTSLCRDVWWESNLAAGRAWLASGGKQAATVGRGVVASSFRRGT